MLDPKKKHISIDFFFFFAERVYITFMHSKVPTVDFRVLTISKVNYDIVCYKYPIENI